MTSNSFGRNKLAKKENTAKRAKKVKPNYQDFLVNLKKAIDASTKKDALATVLKAITQGYEGSIETGHLNEICFQLRQWESFSRIALKIAFKVFVGRSSSLMKRLIIPIRQEAAKRVSGPFDKLPLFSNVYDPDRKKILNDWITTNASKESISHEWARNVIVCIINENITYNDFEIIQLLIEESSSKKGKTSSRSIRKKKQGDITRFKPYLKQVESLFASKNFSLSKASFGIEISKVLQEKLKDISTRIADVEESLEKEKEISTKLEEETKQKAKELVKLVQDNKDYIEKIGYYEQSLKDEKDRYEMLDEHWKQKCEREKKGQAYSQKSYFEHELREAKLSLDRNNPNINMAISRILHMEEYLRNLGDD